MKKFAALLFLSASVASYFVLVQSSTSAPARFAAPDWIYARV